MDDAVLLKKIDSLKRCIERIADKAPAGIEELTDDIDRQDIIVLNLERAVQNSVDIAAHLTTELGTPAPQTMADAFMHIHKAKIIIPHTAERMQKPVGSRNIAVHEYRPIEWHNQTA